MSIINDALKKTQEKLKTKDQNSSDNSDITNIYDKLRQKQITSTNKQQTAKKDQSPRGAKLWKKILTIFFCLGCIGASATFILTKTPLEKTFASLTKNIKRKKSALTVQIKRATNEKSPKKIVPLTEPAPKKASESNQFVLNGTSLIDGKTIAIINGEIYETGDIVSGKKITAISLKEVTLSDDTETITLRP